MEQKALIILIAATGLFSSCSLKRYCQERYPPIQSDSVVTVISYECDYDTVRVPYAEIAFDTAFLPTSIVFHKEQKKGSLSSYIDIQKGKLTFKCAEDSLKQVIEYQSRLIKTVDKRVNTVIIEKYKEHWYLTPLIWWFIISLVAIIGTGAFKYFKLASKI